MAPPGKEQFAAFGFVQFFAAMHVFLHHLWQNLKYFHRQQFRGWGACWVCCFFVLSGFKLTYSQLRRKDPSKIDPFVPYMWRRLARLYPLYYVSLLITAVECYKEGHPRWIVLPFNLTLTFTWIGSVAGGWHAGWHGAHWYMGDLLFHQICWRWAYPVVRRLSDRSCLCLLVVCILITFLRCFLTQWGIAEQETTFWAPYTFNQFLSGMCLAKLHVSRPSPPQGVPADRVALIIGERRVPLSGLGSFALILAVFRLVHPDLAEFYLKRGGWLGSLHPLFVLLVWCICLEEGPLDWLCHRRPFAWMGELSYGVYLFHWNAIRLTVKFGARFLPMRRSEELRFWGIIFPATVLFSALMMFLFDRPVQRWASAFLRGPVTPATVHTKTA